jgi:hypothetical protein
MSQAHLVAGVGPISAEPLSCAQMEVLERAVAKIVLMGDQVGVSPDQMILLLQSGLTVGELLQYLAARNAEVI